MNRIKSRFWCLFTLICRVFSYIACYVFLTPLHGNMELWRGLQCWIDFATEAPLSATPNLTMAYNVEQCIIVHRNIGRSCVDGSAASVNMAGGNSGDRSMTNGSAADRNMADRSVVEGNMADGSMGDGNVADGSATSVSMAYGCVAGGGMASRSMVGGNFAGGGMANRNIVGRSLPDRRLARGRFVVIVVVVRI